MNKTKHLTTVFLLIPYSLFIFSCDGNGNSWKNWSSNYKSFAYDLQGTWETNDANNNYSGRLVISNSTITISGYTSNQGYEWANGTGHRPFKDFTKNAPLEGYTEEGKIFIKDVGIIQEGIPYTYWHTTQQDYTQIYFLSFNFGGRVETLRKQ